MKTRLEALVGRLYLSTEFQTDVLMQEQNRLPAHHLVLQAVLAVLQAVVRMELEVRILAVMVEPTQFALLLQDA